MKINVSKLLLIFGIATMLAAILLLLSGCSAAKKAQKAQTKLNQAAIKVANNAQASDVFYKEYSKTHDITEGKTVYLPGEEIVKEIFIFDTITQPGKTTIHRERVYTDRLRVDTFIRDSPETLANLQLSKSQNDNLEAALAGVQNDLFNYKVAASEIEKKLKAEIRTWRKEAFIHRGVWIAIILFFVIRFASKFLKPLLSLYFPGLGFLTHKTK